MEEVDNIIIHSLLQIGCDIDESITNLAGFDIELIVKATVKCLELIRPDLALSPVLPVNMAARFRMGATLAQICSELGYKGDIGYQTFLYSAEVDLRRVFMFLIEKLPKESDKSINEPDTKSAQLEKLISSAILKQISVPWLPYYCHKKRSKFSVQTKTPFATIHLDNSTVENKEEYHNYNIRYKSSLLEQVRDVKYLVPSVLALNGRYNHAVPSLTITDKIDWLNAQEYDKVIDMPDNESYLINKFISGMNLKDSSSQSCENVDVDVVEIQKQNPIESKENKSITDEQEIERLKSECEALKANIEEIQMDIKKLMSEINHATLIYQNETEALSSHEEQAKIKMKAYELLENGDENVVKLEETIEAYVNKLINLANQWEKHRSSLIGQYRSEKEKHSSIASASQKKLDELQLMKNKEKELIEECRNKDQQYAQLVADIQKHPREVSRSAYTQRILEIINNVKKQKDEIDKILGDTREMQKEINVLTGRLERSFTVVDELIFRDARTNETSKKAYKLLATLHSDCNEIVSLVEETGAIVREIRDLEEQIDSESTKNIGANLERITADLNQMRQETAILTAQLQNKKS
ncbi:PREDICTED: coiled-coil domain-containing protein 22 homolog [Ceratosolen solmsi marchali]|uniref:Coiled-coil domain-containing protein 22 homolog n=1 Tax=Ceratosolen solmsi marchali TaxID=326594 RepID=A0AAJ6YHW0_9HYME|nr:PREDICTED: coiled-coil domain-containing protein 22 homolog [Ceratosolen solmsi marchali]